MQKQQYSMVVKGGRMAWRERGQAIFQHICIVFSLVFVLFNFMFPLLLAKIYQVFFFGETGRPLSTLVALAHSSLVMLLALMLRHIGGGVCLSRRLTSGKLEIILQILIFHPVAFPGGPTTDGRTDERRMTN